MGFWVEASDQAGKRTLIDWQSVVMLRECEGGTEILFQGNPNWVKVDTVLPMLLQKMERQRAERVAEKKKARSDVYFRKAGMK